MSHLKVANFCVCTTRKQRVNQLELNTFDINLCGGMDGEDSGGGAVVVIDVAATLLCVSGREVTMVVEVSNEMPHLLRAV